MPCWSRLSNTPDVKTIVDKLTAECCAEHWVVVNGVDEVTKDEDTFVPNENELVDMPPVPTHRRVNAGRVSLNLAEVQSGRYLGEDSIERFGGIYVWYLEFPLIP